MNLDLISNVASLLLGVSSFVISVWMIRFGIVYYSLPSRNFLLIYGTFVLLRSIAITTAVLSGQFDLSALAQFIFVAHIATAILGISFIFILPPLLRNLMLSIEELRQSGDVTRRLEKSLIAEADARQYHLMADAVPVQPRARGEHA